METILYIILFIIATICLIGFAIGLDEKSRETMEDIKGYVKFRDKMFKEMNDKEKLDGSVG